MVDLALTTETGAANPVPGDLRVDGVELALVQGGDAIAQELEVRLRWWLGEWFLDQRQGVPYVQRILRKGVSEQAVRALLRQHIERSADVARVISIEVTIDRATREASVDFEVLTTEGETLSLAAVPVGG
jgi:hypothetical protein